MVNTKALEETRSNIRAAQESFKLDHTVEIVAVTKTHPFSAIQEVYNKGVVSIGENRVQEAVLKFRSFEKMPKMTKIEIAVAKGKKQYDKRQTKKMRDWNRDRARYVRKTS